MWRDQTLVSALCPVGSGHYAIGLLCNPLIELSLEMALDNPIFLGVSLLLQCQINAKNNDTHSLASPLKLEFSS